MIDAKTFQKNNVYISHYFRRFFSNPRATEQTKTCYNKNHDARPRSTLAAHLATPINHLTNVGEKRHRLKGNSVNHRGNLYSVFLISIFITRLHTREMQLGLLYTVLFLYFSRFIDNFRGKIIMCISDIYRDILFYNKDLKILYKIKFSNFN